MLLFPDEDTARRESGYFCPANMPRSGEKVYVVGDKQTMQKKRTATVISSQSATQQALYDGSGAAQHGLLQPTPGFESDCTVEVKYDDDGSVGTVSAAVLPTPLWQKALDQLSVAAFIAFYGWVFLAPDGERAWTGAREDHEELNRELKEAGRTPKESQPLSGEYWGSSEESDDGDQAVRSTLNFAEDGRIKGRGIDGVDGAYRITDGRWGVLKGGKVTVTWIEVYDEGFRVAVSGSYNVRDGKIRGRFTSSRGVRGRFDLAPKPSIF